MVKSVRTVVKRGLDLIKCKKRLVSYNIRKIDMDKNLIVKTISEVTDYFSNDKIMQYESIKTYKQGRNDERLLLYINEPKYEFDMADKCLEYEGGYNFV